MGDARAIFDRLTDAVNAHDIEGVSACYGDDVIVVSPDGTFKGRGEAASVIEQFLTAFPDLRVDCWNKLTAGELVADEWTMTGTNTGPLPLPGGETVPATGRTIRLRGADVGVVEHGHVTSHRMYWDQADLAEQLGLSGQ